MADAAVELLDFTAGHPPKPRLTLRVGISGHRPKPHKFPADQHPRVQRQLAEVFAAIDTTLADLHTKNQEFYTEERPKLRLVSGLAEGADQMAVAARPAKSAVALQGDEASAVTVTEPQCDWEVDAILPFPENSYRADFKESAADKTKDVTAEFLCARVRATTVVELPDDPLIVRKELTKEKDEKKYWEVRNAGYARLGAFLLRQIDVLVAVWDGKIAEGPGGTADVVRAAIKYRIPVVWINALNDTMPRMVVAIDDDDHPIAPDADCMRGPLADAISTLVSAPLGAPTQNIAQAGADANVKRRLDDFFAETWPRATHWFAYDYLKRLINGGKRRYLIQPGRWSDHDVEWTTFTQKAPAAPDLAVRIQKILMPRFVWADTLAVSYSHRYRSAYVICYLLAALAVFVALLALFIHAFDIFHLPEMALVAKSFLVAIEIGVVMAILWIVKTGRRCRWHGRWLEYRALAERLRDARFLVYIGEHGRVQRVDSSETAASAWFVWYLRSTLREIGLPTAVLDGTFQHAHLVAVDTHVVVDQINYHQPNAASLERMHLWLHEKSKWCFIITTIVLLAFIVAAAIFFLGRTFWLGPGYAAQIQDGAHVDILAHASLCVFSPWPIWLGHLLVMVKDFVTLAVAFLPALGASLAGIREIGDFEGFAARSAKTAAELIDIRGDIARAKRSLLLETTAEVLFDTAQVLSDDLVAWQSVYGRKRLDLP